MVNSGSYKLGPQNGRLTVKIERDGAAKKMGHDLTLEVSDWSADVTVDADDPSKSTVTVTAKPASMTIAEATGGMKPLSDGDKKDIKKNIDDKILNTGQNPEITFKSTKVSGDEKRASVAGDLTISGSTQPASMSLQISDTKVSGSMDLTQTQFGLKPFSAFMGALKVKDRVKVDIEGDLK
jgi:polyisoprenoid-binding protein YceI